MKNKTLCVSLCVFAMLCCWCSAFSLAECLSDCLWWRLVCLFNRQWQQQQRGNNKGNNKEQQDLGQANRPSFNSLQAAHKPVYTSFVCLVSAPLCPLLWVYTVYCVCEWVYPSVRVLCAACLQEIPSNSCRLCRCSEMNNIVPWNQVITLKQKWQKEGQEDQQVFSLTAFFWSSGEYLLILAQCRLPYTGVN